MEVCLCVSRPHHSTKTHESFISQFSLFWMQVNKADHTRHFANLGVKFTGPVQSNGEIRGNDLCTQICVFWERAHTHTHTPVHQGGRNQLESRGNGWASYNSTLVLHLHFYKSTTLFSKSSQKNRNVQLLYCCITECQRSGVPLKIAGNKHSESQRMKRLYRQGSSRYFASQSRLIHELRCAKGC